jgi:hypothetical protein
MLIVVVMPIAVTELNLLRYYSYYKKKNNHAYIADNTPEPYLTPLGIHSAKSFSV